MEPGRKVALSFMNSVRKVIIRYSFRMAFQPVVISGPSGSGKSTLVNKLMKEFDDCFAFSVSHTTRSPRAGEVNGKDYNFVTTQAIKTQIEAGDFIEHAEFSGNFYGTSKRAVEDVSKTGRICILDVDMQGVKSIKATSLNPKYIFIQPPDLCELEKRLRNRGTETEESTQKRLSSAKPAIEYAKKKGIYDHVIINDDVDSAYLQLKEILSEDIKEFSSKISL